MLKKFILNLIILSVANNFEEAAKEWIFIQKKEDKNKENHCLCASRRLLIHQFYYLNINTKKIICCGDTCRTYIDENVVRHDRHNRLRDDLINCGLLSENIGEYDLNEWCKKNEEIIFNNFINKIDLLLTSDECHKYIEYLNEYWFELIDIDELLDKLYYKIEQFEMERLERERLERERLERERLEREKLEKDNKCCELYGIKSCNCGFYCVK